MIDYMAIRKTLGETATDTQRRAANPSNSVWVEASAGTGKTQVLSDRVLRLLLDDVKPMRLLCLTYTKAAAVEMNSRISERLSEWAVIDEAELEDKLKQLLGAEISSAEKLRKYKAKARTLFAELLDTPGGIKIQTIHSFCTDVLKRFPLEAKVSPYFEVLEDEESTNALTQIKTEILLKENHNGDNKLSAAIDYFAENMSETAFPSMLKKITEKRREMVEVLSKNGGLSNFLKALAEKLNINTDETEESIKAEFMQATRRQLSDVVKNISAWSHGTESTDKPKVKICTDVIERNFQTEDYEIYKLCFFTGENEPRKERSLATKDAKDADSELMSRLFAEQERLKISEEKLQKLRLYQSTKSAFTIVREIDKRYEQYKREKSCMDFSDLIYKTRALLNDNNSSARQWVLYKLDGGIDHILLDEAQDTSPEQWDIVASLCDDFFSGEGQTDVNRTIFVVGDRKQSIFSFQGADPDKFDKMAEYFKEKAENARKVFEPVTLGVSFRSAPAVLEAVNKIFATEQAADGVVTDSKTFKHTPVRAGEFGKVTVLPMLEADSKNTAEDYEHWEPPMERVTKISVETQMAREIAQRIRRMVDERAQTSKPLHYRDFMVLVRTRNGFVQEFIRACEQEHIAISGADKMVLSEEIAVQDLISLGKFLLYPKDSLSLAEVLTSPLFSIDGQLLEDLCYNRNKGEELWNRIQASNDSRCREIFGVLKTLQDNLDHIRPYEMYNFVLTKMGGRRKFIERMGQEVEDTLDEFINMTLAYEQRQIPSLRGFITWFGQSEKEIKRESDEAETDAVRLLTVHHSKGLQAPIVFLPDTAKTPSDRRQQTFLQDDELAYYPLNASAYDDICNSIKEKNRIKEMKEYRRLLYVALTRAEDQLFICAHGPQKSKKDAKSDKKDKPEKQDSWYDLCRNALSTDNTDATAEIICETKEEVAKKEKKKSLTAFEKFAFEPWIDENLTQKEDNLSKPYTPSKIEEKEDELPDSVSPLKNNGIYFRRGILIHRLLQFLPAKLQNKDAVIDEYLRKNAADFSADDCAQIKEEVLALLNNGDFADIFGADSRAEVPVVGEVEGKIISAQLDRLIVLPDRVKIVDFKTNRPAAKDAAHTPKQYLTQLAVYAKLMQKIYPQKTVETYILWTNETRLMRIA
ncbi:MAG: double-strand break repair helicase AddA [Alphaproteobacteria bacterium]|nr:double-strand break repair helicase AddA [Alphaproteobacteria bacterium]